MLDIQCYGGMTAAYSSGISFFFLQDNEQATECTLSHVGVGHTGKLSIFPA